MIILILFGLMQALILPGLLLSYSIKKINFIGRIIFSSALSLVINYLVVWLLYITNLYSKLSLIIILASEFLLFFYLRDLFIKDIKNSIHRIFQLFLNILKTKSINLHSLFFILFCIYYFYLLKTSGFLTVFTHWDAVVSWNRWAVELHTGTFKGSWGYPQGIPVLFSIIYTISNETNIQTLVKYICVYWPFLGGIALFSCGIVIPKLKHVFALSSIFYLYMLSKGSWTIDFIFSGLVDPIMAAFGAIFIYCVLLLWSKNINKNSEYIKIITLAVISVLGGALVKMTGAILIIDFLILTYFIFIYNSRLNKSDGYYFLVLVFITIVAATHWYLFTTFYWKDWPDLSDYNSLQDARIWIRPYFHFVLFGSTFGWIFTLLAVLGSFSSFKAFGFLTLIILPLFLFCGIVVGYDLRATFVLFAPISLLAALGVRTIYTIFNMFCLRINEYLSTSHFLAKYLPLILFIVLAISTLFGLSKTFSRENILKSNTEKRVLANDFALAGNKRLLQIFEKEPNSRIISCWQTPIGLPGAIGKFLPTGNCTVSLLTGWLADENIKYWLYKDEGTSKQALTPEFINKFLSSQPRQIHTENLGSGFVLYSK